MTTTHLTDEFSSAMQDPLHVLIRSAVLRSYQDRTNAGKPVDPFLVEAIVGEVTAAIEREAHAIGGNVQDSAIDALLTERVYQDAGFGNAADTITGEGPGDPMTPGECLGTIQYILNEAWDLWYKPQNRVALMHRFRKIGGVALQAMERYGVYPRQFTEDQKNILANQSWVDAALRTGLGGGKADRLQRQARQQHA